MVPRPREPVKEEAPLRAHTLPYAIHKRECDEVVRYRAESLGDCHTYLVRPHIFAGASVQNYMIGALRGTPLGSQQTCRPHASRGKRLPWLLPRGNKYLEKRLQFVHVDDMARLLVHLLNRPASDPSLTILNVAGRGEPITLQQCAEIAQATIKRAPNRAACRAVFRFIVEAGDFLDSPCRPALSHWLVHHGYHPAATLPWRRVWEGYSILRGRCAAGQL